MAGLRRYDEEKERLPRLLREGSPWQQDKWIHPAYPALINLV
jgi:hypothetical protein